jgi:hypothetical protein
MLWQESIGNLFFWILLKFTSSQEQKTGAKKSTPDKINEIPIHFG